MTTLVSILSGCASVSRKNFPESYSNTDVIKQMIHYASLAGNSHNTQPWKVEIIDSHHLVIRPDLGRKLQVVDPSARGLYISLGAFVENLCLTAGHFGYEAILEYRNLTSEEMTIDLQLYPRERKFFDLEKIEQRRTLRTPFKKDEITLADLSVLLGEEGEPVYYIPAGSDKGRYIAEKTMSAYEQQAKRKEAQEELASWIRFSNRDVREKRDGLTTSGMGIAGVGGFMVRNFLKPEDSMKDSFVKTGIDKTREQVENCAGWILILQDSDFPESWVRTGRLYQRMNLECRDLLIGFHPMNQMIEEAEFETLANQDLGLVGKIQFVARIGYVDQYPEPVSVRRPVESFITDKR